jgi:cobyrinic acid a,c-diamide synthase
MELLDLHKIKIQTPFIGKGTLARRVSMSDVFIIYGTQRYYNSLLLGDDEICESIRLAKEFEKPVILLLDTKLSESQIVDMRTIKGINIIKEIIYDFSDVIKKKETEKEITRICEEIDEMNNFAFRSS